MRHFRATWVVLAGASLAIGIGCGGSGDSNKGAGGGSSTGGSGVGGSGTGGGTGIGGADASAGGQGGVGGVSGQGGFGLDGGFVYGTTQCSDGIDNDGDGKIDSADPECTSPLDNDESSYATGIPGDNKDPNWQDCFFDGNSGAGDDGCRYNTCCLTGACAQTDPSCTQITQACRDFCQKYTPNGCDCFGCCAVDTPTGTVNIMLSSTCSLADINDPTKCPRCTQTTACTNTCEHCELCLGKDTLPADCMPDAGVGGAPPDGPVCVAPACPAPEQPCGLSCTAACPALTYCTTGCCVDVIR